MQAFCEDPLYLAYKPGTGSYKRDTNRRNQIFQFPDLRSVSVIECVDSLLPILSKDAPLRRSSNRETLTEICVADLGDQWSKSPYLIVCLLELSLSS